MRWEVLGDDVVGLDSSAGVVHRLTDHSAVVARHLLTGESHPYDSEEFDYIVSALLEENLVVTDDVSLMSRRDLFRVGAAAALGVSILMLPTAAAAASGGGGTQTSPSAVPAPDASAGSDYVIVSWS